MDKFISFVNMIQIRPSSYLSQRSVTQISMLFLGYESACMVYKLEGNPHEFLFRFGEFVSQYYELATSSKGWSQIILEKNNGDEEKGLNDFFRLFELFLKVKG